MLTTDRKTIMNQLQVDISQKLNPANGYKTALMDIRVGVFDATEFTTLPSAGLWMLDDLIEDDLMDTGILRRLNLIIYAYIESDGYSGYDATYDLIDDFEKFLYSSDCSYYQNVNLGNVNITYGGTNNQIGMFVVNFSILYIQRGLSS
jgi:hypothetical protein